MSQAAQALVDIIIRENANPGEQQNAMSGLRRMASRAGSVEKLFANGRGGASAPPPPVTSFNAHRRATQELNDEISRLNTDLIQKDKRIGELTLQVARLTDETTALRSSMKKTIKADSDGSMPYDDWTYKAEQILGNRGWKNHMVQQTGIEFRAIERARVSGSASKELVDLLSTLVPPPRNHFSPEEVKMIRSWATKHGDSGIADRATAQFGKGIITPAMIRKLRTDIKNKNGLYRNPEYGDRLPISNGRTAPRPRFAWSDHPEVEVRAAQMFIEGGSAIDIAKMVSEATQHDIGANQITQRVYNSLPPAQMINSVGKGPLTWPEVWFIFKSIARGKTWLAAARTALLLPEDAKSVIGMSLDHLTGEQIAAIRALYRHRVKEK